MIAKQIPVSFVAVEGVRGVERQLHEISAKNSKKAFMTPHCSTALQSLSTTASYPDHVDNRE